jgi:hypothetical protein
VLEAQERCRSTRVTWADLQEAMEEVSLLEKVVLALIVVKAGVVKEGPGFLPSRQVLSYAIRRVSSRLVSSKPCAIKAVCHQSRVPSRCPP